MFLIGADDGHRRPRRDDWSRHAVAFREYREAIAIVAADAGEQVAWADANSWPWDEIRQTLDDAVYCQQGLLRRAWLLTDHAIEGVAQILAEFDAWTDESLWRSEEALKSRAEWARVRSIAKRALELLDAWRAETGAIEHGMERDS